tara:strand:+ start:445 stop:675 length:231 start_codon:yes stop_codon:yes gene_type:complete
MNNDKFQIGDLVSHPWTGVGLVVRTVRMGLRPTVLLDVYWFKLGKTLYGRREEITKLKAPKNPNEPSKAHNGSHQL